MAISVADNFSYKGSKPLDARIQYASLTAMKNATTSDLYDGCLAYVTAVKKNYQYDSANTVDPTTGKWRELETGGGGGGTTYTAGDGINIDANNEISVKEMAQSDMSEIVTPLPGAMSRRMKYSTEEQVVGEWIDGKLIYEMTINFGTLPNNTAKSYPHGIRNLDKVISLTGWTYIFGQGTYYFNIPYPNPSIVVSADTSNVYVGTEEDLSASSAYIIIRYTKTAN